MRDVGRELGGYRETATFRQAYGTNALLWVQLIFAVVMIMIAGVAVVYIGDAEHSLTIFRDRVKRCVQRLDPASRDLLGDSPRKYRWPLSALVWGTCIFAVVLVFVR
ncbi:MAG TPA: hypothetical protein VK886_04765 [Vicinamibacterales bacterium]|nr:hypothetical protein [Vicinamibacterales bacterium]